MRSQCLRLLAQLFSRFPGALDFNAAWPSFFGSMAPLMLRVVAEAAAPVAPALLGAVAALAASPGLARVLGNLPSVQQAVSVAGAGAGAAAEAGAAAVMDEDVQGWPPGAEPAWAAAGLGGRLLSSCVAVLGAPGCSDASLAAGLSVVEACLALQPPCLVRLVLLPWTQQLLVQLRASVDAALTAAAGGGGGGKRPRVCDGPGTLATCMLPWDRRGA